MSKRKRRTAEVFGASCKWGATVIRVYKYAVRIRLNTSPYAFSVLRPHINATRPLRSGDQLYVTFEQIQRDAP